MITNTIVNTISNIISKEIRDDFEQEIKHLNVSKNWFRTIHPNTMFWQLSILIPRTRWSKSDWTTYIPNLNNFSFSQIVDYFIQTVVTLMSIGNTFQDIKFFFQNNYWFSIWNNLLSRIYNSLYDWFIQRKSKSLPEFFIAFFLDAMYIKLKVDNSIKSVPVYFIIWILPSWEKQVLDFIIDTEPENSSKYLEVLNNIKNRWVKHVLFSIFDWLPWLANACKLAFPDTILQRCIVHKLRYSMKFIQSSDEKEFLKDLKSVYNAPNIQEATRLLENFQIKRKKYKVILDDWLYSMDEWWNYFKYSYPIRKLIYTTNIIEAFNSLIRRHM